MKKLFGTLFLIFSLWALLLLSLYPETNHILASALTTKFKTKVSVARVKVKPFNQFGILNLKISNLENYPTPYALEVGKIEVKAPFTNFINNVTEIEAIKLTDFTLYINYSKGVSNWETILKNLNHAPANLENKTFIDTYSIIDKLAITNIKIYVENEDGRSKIYNIEKLYLKDVKTLNGQLTRRVSEAIVSQFFFNFKNIVDVPLQMPAKLLANPIEGTIEEIEALIKIF
jgi:hypothetical protein